MVMKNAQWNMIPKDWDVVVLGEYSEIARGGSPRPIQDYLTSNCRGINWIKIGDVSKSSKYIFSTAEKIIPEGVSKSRTVFSGDLILSNSMSFGRPYILKIDGCIHDGWLVIQNYQSVFDKEYLYYCLGSEFTIQQYISMAAGSSVQNLNKDKVSAVIIAKPPIKEQIAIAEALSNIDNLIFSLQKLIDKKKVIKQGAMQELLTGKKRLPGFYGDWRIVQIGETLSIGHGQSQKAIENRFGKYPILATGGCIGYANDFLWDKPSVLIGRKGTIDKPQYADHPFWTIDTLFYTKIFDGYDAKFIYYKFCMIDWQQYNEASGVPSLNTTTIENLQIIVPEKDEQQAIAQLLSDMDSEIEQLEKKLSKYQQIKQGMMQELLTGRIRLV